MSLKEKAREVLQIIDRGGYQIGSDWIDLRTAIDRAVEQTTVYAPGDYRIAVSTSTSSLPDTIYVTAETTQQAVKRLCAEHDGQVAALNFASARNPGGGFINGAKAQEEDLARCSAVYPCLMGASDYYDANKNQSSMIYTDHIIFSPAVPFFRARSRDDCEQPFFASVITAPAPNARQAVRHGEALSDVHTALRKRMTHVLEVAQVQGVVHLVLGAWGCGVFGNDPVFVAGAFRQALTQSEFVDTFASITFAVYDRSKGRETRAAFEDVLAG